MVVESPVEVVERWRVISKPESNVEEIRRELAESLLLGSLDLLSSCFRRLESRHGRISYLC